MAPTSEWLSKDSGIQKKAVSRRNTAMNGKKEAPTRRNTASTQPPGGTAASSNIEMDEAPSWPSVPPDAWSFKLYGLKDAKTMSQLEMEEQNPYPEISLSGTVSSFQPSFGKDTVKKGKFDEKDKTRETVSKGTTPPSQLPPVLYPPLLQPIAISDDTIFVYFDLETTGLAYPRHITQIAARRQHSDTDVFHHYVKPERPIESEARKITGISFDEAAGQMYHHGIPVHSVSIVQALQEFVAFLTGLGITEDVNAEEAASSSSTLCSENSSSSASLTSLLASKPKVVLLGHNAKTYDCPILLNAARACHLVKNLKSAVLGFVDTLPVLKQALCLKSYKQTNLYKHFFGKADGTGTSAESGPSATQSSDQVPLDAKPHDAREDVRRLDQIMTRSEEIAPLWLSRAVLSGHSFTVDHVLKTLDYRTKESEVLEFPEMSD